MTLARIIYFPVKSKKQSITIREATHWIPSENNPYSNGSLTIGKEYEIIYDEARDEFYMLDDLGENTVWWSGVHGEFIVDNKYQTECVRVL